MEDRPPREDPFKDMHPDDALKWGGPLLEPQVSLFLKNPFSLLRQVMGFAISVIVQTEEAKKFLEIWINLVEHFKELMAAGRVQEIDDPTQYEIDLQTPQSQKVVSLFGEMGIEVYKNLHELQKNYQSLLNNLNELDAVFYKTFFSMLKNALPIMRQNFNAKTKRKSQKLEKLKARLPEILDKIKLFNALIERPTYDNNPVVVEGKNYTKAEMKEEVEKLEKEKEKIYEKERKLQVRIEFEEKFFDEMEKLDNKGIDKIRDNEEARNIIKKYLGEIDKAQRSGLTGEKLEKNIKEIKEKMNEKLMEVNLKGFVKHCNISQSREYLVKELLGKEGSSKEGFNAGDMLVKYQSEREKILLKIRSVQSNMKIQKSTFGSALNNINQNKVTNDNNYKSPRP